MIVVVGHPAWRGGERGRPAGRACEIALAVAGSGARAEVVGRVGDDPAGDRLLIALALAGVGHAAVLRDPARPTPVLAEDPEPEPDPADAFAEPPEPPEPPEPADAFADPADAAPALGGRSDLAAPRGQAASTGPRLQPADVALGLQYLTAFNVLVVADDAPPEVLPACVDGAAFAGASLVVLVREGSAPPADLGATATVLEAPARDDGAFGTLVGLYAARLDAGDDPAQAFRAALDEGWSAPVS